MYPIEIAHCTMHKSQKSSKSYPNWKLMIVVVWTSFKRCIYISKIKIISTKIIMQFQIIMHLKFDDFMRITYLTSQQNSYGRAINERKILYIVYTNWFQCGAATCWVVFIVCNLNCLSLKVWTLHCFMFLKSSLFPKYLECTQLGFYHKFYSYKPL